MPRSARHILKHALTRLPVTSLLLCVSCVLYVLSEYVAWTGGEEVGFYPYPGALPGLRLVDFPEISGPFDLWEGQWWRLLGSAFHHGGGLHLVLNAMAIWVMGDILESRLGRFRYLVFFLCSALLSVCAAVAMGHAAIGLSGVAYAEFGLLIILRRHDRVLARVITHRFILTGMVWLAVGGLLTELQILPIANDAHIAGLLYGLAIGWLRYEVGRHHRPVGFAGVVAVNASTILISIVLMEPVWDARYLVWRALHDEEPALLEQAALRDPRLTPAWNLLASHHYQAGDLLLTWQTLLKGARSNRTDDVFLEKARWVWTMMRTATMRARALEDLKAIFGDEADNWLVHLQLSEGSMSRSRAAGLLEPRMIDLFPEFVDLEQLKTLPSEVPGITRTLAGADAPPIDPDDPASALLGETL